MTKAHAGMFSHLSQVSFAQARRRLFSWFQKPIDTIVMNPWDAIIDYNLYQQTSHFLFYFIQAASTTQAPESLLDRLQVVWIWLNKHPDPPEHEYIIIETKDLQDGKTRLFVLDRVQKGPDSPEEPKPATSKKDSKRPDTGNYQRLEDVQKSILPSSSSLSSMEEGTLTSTAFYPPVSFPAPQNSLGDTISLSATKVSLAVSESLDKGGDKMGACDRMLGESAITRRRYGIGRNARQIKPNNLTLFELAVLAEAVHDFASDYSYLERNCYWFCNMVVDAIIEIFHVDDSVDPKDGRICQYKPIDPYQSDISGRWRGWKISQTDPTELSKIVHDFKKAHTAAISEVEVSF